MKWTRRFATLLLSCAFGSAHAAYQVEVEADAGLQKLLTTHLDLVRYQSRTDINEEQFQFMLATLSEQVRALSSTAGYFSPVTSVNVIRADNKHSDNGANKTALTKVMVHVEAGPQTKIAAVDIQVEGNAAQQDAARVAQIQQQWGLPVGAPFEQEAWDKAKNQGLDTLQRHQYAAARIAGSQAAIDPDQQEADLSVHYDSGPAFTLGPLVVTGARRYPVQIIENVNPLRIGEDYDVNRLLTLQRQIQNTPYFSNVIVGIDNDPEHAEMAPVKVQVTEFQTQRVRFGIGYSTDTGAQVETRYSHYNVFGSAWVFDSQLQIEQERKYGLLSLSMPPDDKNFVNSVTASLEHTTSEGIDLRSLQTGIKRTRNGELYDTTYSLIYYRDALEQASGAALPSNTVVTPGKHQALVPGFAWARRNVDDPIFPRSGNLFTVETGFAVQGMITDQTFSRAYLRFKQFFPVGQRDVIIFRSELGAVFTNGSASQVPASLLFRAGGNESVRGYGYDSIGNSQNGTVFPTKYLVTASGEYQHWINPSWGGAVFYDVGTAADSWSNRSLYTGIGPGLRWRSPVGSLNFDIGYGVQRHQFRPHLSLGIAF
ncbi:translocation and assembly module TamA [Herbaspirillum sp. Sphag1AN]|uniref:autotransporter assembly complex protein TamA n=1 Tax=unclassified Herbaspirillum TaxID=2624150 RepID=UPI00161C92B0|nr:MULTISPECIES: autotransporter assembly complex family protein [unclassified Herbaspirillum]MBB3210815.1 translocation and assembly module TamA [Herbaspirillum sp. Sphag1AN]MBB3244445.1 translocation and assembly module TamA [Herbaspirillum sp. Sphag64]